MRNYIFVILILLLDPYLFYAQTENKNVSPIFREAFKDFARVEKNLRKWDAPVIADLDQDGYFDILINEHGYGISVCWNNKGKFAKPFDIIIGDIHGIALGDFDMDGNLELAVSRGGGSGSNARNTKLFRVDKNRNFTELPDFKEPLKTMRGRTLKWFDGDNDGDLDLVNFGF
ncbi:MAG: VCBS repeat-containing protein, partial [Saprospiraceae bacterium]